MTSAIFCLLLMIASAVGAAPPHEPVAALDALHGERLVAFLGQLKGVHRDYARQLGQDRYRTILEARHGIAAALRRAGLSSDDVRSLRRVIEDRGDRLVDDAALLERLLPLRLAEAVLADGGGLRPPWGLIDRKLGAEVHQLLILVKAAGWHRVGVTEYEQRTQVPPSSHHRFTWLWCCTATTLQRNRAGDPSMLVNSAIPLVGSLPDEGVRRPADWQCRLETTIDIVMPAGRKWPPERACISLVTRGLAREYLLTLRLNGGSPFVVVNATPFLTGDPTFSSLNLMYYLVPVPVAMLEHGRNALSLDISALPHDEPSIPFRLRDVGIMVR